MGIAHLALDLRLGNECGNGVDDDDVQAPRADEHVGDLEGLLTGVRLGDEEVVGINPQSLGVDGVERVLGVDEGGIPPGLLGAGHGVERNGRLTRGLGPVDLDDAPAGQAPDPQGDVEGGRTGGDDGHGRTRVISQSHDGALTEGLVDLGERGGQGLGAVLGLGDGWHWTTSVSVLGRLDAAAVRTGPVAKSPLRGSRTTVCRTTDMFHRARPGPVDARSANVVCGAL